MMDNSLPPAVPPAGRSPSPPQPEGEWARWIVWREEVSEALAERWARITQRWVLFWLRVGSTLAGRLRFLSPLSFEIEGPPADAVEGTRTGYSL